MRIDSYSHCGIQKYQPVAVVLEVMAKAGVDRAVLCQHLGEYDNSYLAETVRNHPGRFAAVALVNPEVPAAMETLRSWKDTGQFRGVRLLAEWLEPYLPLWMEAARMGLRLVLYAPNGIAGAIPTIRRLLRECPECNVVVSHLGNPQLQNGILIAGTELFELEKEDGVWVLLSGLSMFCPYPYTELKGLVAEVFLRFGPDRILWGSNFPVCGGEESYRRDLSQLLSGHWDLSAEAVLKITGGTAETLWFSP